MKNHKSILAKALAIVMCFTFIPVNGFALENDPVREDFQVEATEDVIEITDETEPLNTEEEEMNETEDPTLGYPEETNDQEDNQDSEVFEEEEALESTQPTDYIDESQDDTEETVPQDNEEEKPTDDLHSDPKGDESEYIVVYKKKVSEETVENTIDNGTVENVEQDLDGDTVALVSGDIDPEAVEDEPLVEEIYENTTYSPCSWNTEVQSIKVSTEQSVLAALGWPRAVKQVTWANNRPKIAVIDNGFYQVKDNSDMSDHVAGVYEIGSVTNIDRRKNHGTGMASIIGAKKNGIGMTGICNPKLYLYVAPTLSDYDISKAITEAVKKGARVINLSFGRYEYSEKDRNAYMCKTIRDMKSKNVLFVCASGNEVKRTTRHWPAQLANESGTSDYVISVTAINPKSPNNVIYSSNNPTLAASDGLCSYVGKSTTPVRGAIGSTGASATSGATAAVSGMAGLLLQKYPKTSAKQLKTALTATTHDIGRKGKDQSFGYGLVDVNLAMQYLAGKKVSGHSLSQSRFTGILSTPKVAINKKGTAKISYTSIPNTRAYLYKTTGKNGWVKQTVLKSNPVLVKCPKGKYRYFVQYRQMLYTEELPITAASPASALAATYIKPSRKEYVVTTANPAIPLNIKTNSASGWTIKSFPKDKKGRQIFTIKNGKLVGLTSRYRGYVYIYTKNAYGQKPSVCKLYYYVKQTDWNPKVKFKPKKRETKISFSKHPFAYRKGWRYRVYVRAAWEPDYYPVDRDGNINTPNSFIIGSLDRNTKYHVRIKAKLRNGDWVWAKDKKGKILIKTFETK